MDVVVGPSNHICLDSAHYAGRADVVGEDRAVGHRGIRIRDKQVFERKEDRRLLERGLERLVDRRRRGGDRGEIFEGRIRCRRLAVVLTLGRRSVARNQDTQLVGPLHRDVVAGRVDDRGPKPPGHKRRSGASGNHPALEHFVDDGWRDLVEERLASADRLRSSWIARCSASGLGLPWPAGLSCQSCSQLAVWYFWEAHAQTHPP